MRLLESPWLPDAVGGVLLGAALFMFVLGWRRRAVRRWGLAAGLAAVAAMAFWLRRGGQWPWPRAYVVVIGSETAPVDRAYFLSLVGDDDPVAFVTMGDRAAAGTDPQPWKTAGDLRRGGIGAIQAALSAAPTVAWDDPRWLDSLLAASHSQHARRTRLQRLLRQPTTLVVFDGGAKWRQLSMESVPPLGHAKAKLLGGDEQLFCADAPGAALSGSLNVRMPTAPLQTMALGQYLDEVEIELRDYPVTGAAPVAAEVVATLDLRPGSDTVAVPGGSLPAPSPAPAAPPLVAARAQVKMNLAPVPGGGGTTSLQGHLRLGSLLPVSTGGVAQTSGARLSPGFHRLNVSVAVPRPNPLAGSMPQDTYTATSYFEVVDRQVVVLQPAGQVGSLANPSWRLYGMTPIQPGTPGSADLRLPVVRPTTLPAKLDRLLTGHDSPVPGEPDSGRGFLLEAHAYHGGRAQQESSARGILPLDNYSALPIGRVTVPGTALALDSAAAWGREDRKKVEDGSAANPEAAEVRRFLGRLEQSRCLVLVEPTSAQLLYLDELLGLAARIGNGLEVLVVGPPPFQALGDRPAWLPWASAPLPNPPPPRPGGPALAGPSGPAQPWRVHRDFRLYICPDNGQTLINGNTVRNAAGTGPGGRLTANDVFENYSPLEAQRDIIRDLYQGLSATVPNAEGIAIPVPASGAADIDRFATDTVEGQKRNDFHSVLHGLDRPAFGALGRYPITIYPPITHAIRNEELGALYRTGREEDSLRAAMLSMMPSQLDHRLQSLTGDLGPKIFGSDYQPLEYPHLYPNSTVVAFVVDRPQFRVPSKMIRIPAFGKVGGAYPEEKDVQLVAVEQAQPHTVEDLVRMGVRVVVVLIKRPGDDVHEGTRVKQLTQMAPQVGTLAPLQDLLAVDRKRVEGFVEPDDRYVTQMELSFADVADKATDPVIGEKKARAKKVAEDILKLLAERKQGGTLVRAPGSGGRIVDERTRTAAEAPSQHVYLIPAGAGPGTAAAALDPFEPEYARIRDGAEPFRVVRDTPAVLARSFGEGHVIVTAYSPFAEDVYHSDAGTAAWPPGSLAAIEQRLGPDGAAAWARPRMQGWGPQRVLDTLALTGFGRALPTAPVVRGVEAAADGATVLVTCSAGFAGATAAAGSPSPGTPPSASEPLAGTGWPTPTLINPVSRKVHDLDLVSIDPVSRACAYRFSADRDWADVHGLCAVRIGPNVTWVYLSLRRALARGAAPKQVVADLAWMSGGALLRPDTARVQLAFARPTAWVIGFLLCAAVAALFLVRAVVRARLFIRERRRLRQAKGAGGSPAALDVEALVAEWGLYPGPPRTGRQAGLPGGERQFQAGDDLSSAKPATLFPFTDLARVIDLPIRKPVVRIRHLGSRVEATILLDASPGMAIPSRSRFLTKARFATDLVRLLAGIIWARGGSVKVATLQAPERAWEGGGAGDDEELARAVRQMFEGSGGASTGAAASATVEEMGGLLFIVTDLMGIDDETVSNFVRRAAQDGASVRLAHMYDPDEKDLVGLCWNVTAGMIHDRTEWDPAQVQATYRLRVAHFQHLVEAAEGRFVSLTTDLSTTAVSEKLQDAEFL